MPSVPNAARSVPSAAFVRSLLSTEAQAAYNAPVDETGETEVRIASALLAWAVGLWTRDPEGGIVFERTDGPNQRERKLLYVDLVMKQVTRLERIKTRYRKLRDAAADADDVKELIAWLDSRGR